MIDLDGVLNNYTHYTNEIPEIRKGAKEFTIKFNGDYNKTLDEVNDFNVYWKNYSFYTINKLY